MSGHLNRIAEHYRKLAAEEVALAKAAVTNDAHVPAHFADRYGALGWQRPANLFHLRKHRGDADTSRDAPDRSLSETQRLEPNSNIGDRAADSA
jgi:hypothetical protein